MNDLSIYISVKQQVVIISKLITSIFHTFFLRTKNIIPTTLTRKLNSEPWINEMSTSWKTKKFLMIFQNTLKWSIISDLTIQPFHFAGRWAFKRLKEKIELLKQIWQQRMRRFSRETHTSHLNFEGRRNGFFWMLLCYLASLVRERLRKVD